jgi:hypothetical protein
MFDLHLGAQLRVPSVAFKDGFFVTGNAGQGKSVWLEQLMIEVIKNRQTGLLLDPFGDLAKETQGHLKTPAAKAHVAFCNFDLPQKQLNTFLKDKFVVASGRMFKDGYRKTHEQGAALLSRFFKQAKPGQWLIVDEALSFVTDDLFEQYLQAGKLGLNAVFSAMDFYQFSEEERHRFARHVKNLIIYKPRNINAIMMAKEWKGLNPEQIKALRQYHFQALIDGKLSHHLAHWPIESI